MSATETILVAVDPSQVQHPALERALITSRLSLVKPRLHLFIAVDADARNVSADNPALYSSLGMINELAAIVEAEGVAYSVELCWASSWQQAMLNAAKRVKADLIVMTDHSDVNRKLYLADSKWELLRRARRPVLLVRPQAQPKRKVVLASVNIQATEQEQLELNQRILEQGREMSDRYDAELHVVNSYKDSMNYPDRGMLLRQAKVTTDRVHLKQGAPEVVVAATAKNIGADIVVIGTLARRSVMESMRGNTSERVLNSLSQDVLTIN